MNELRCVTMKLLRTTCWCSQPLRDATLHPSVNSLGFLAIFDRQNPGKASVPAPFLDFGPSSSVCVTKHFPYHSPRVRSNQSPHNWLDIIVRRCQPTDVIWRADLHMQRT